MNSVRHNFHTFGKFLCWPWAEKFEFEHEKKQMSRNWAFVFCYLFKNLASIWRENCHIIRGFGLAWSSYPREVFTLNLGLVIRVLAQKTKCNQENNFLVRNCLLIALKSYLSSFNFYTVWNNTITIYQACYADFLFSLPIDDSRLYS